MKVKEFVKQLYEIGFNDETEIVFNIKNEDSETFADYYCQNMYRFLDGYNAMGVDIDRKYKGKVDFTKEKIWKQKY